MPSTGTAYIAGFTPFTDKGVVTGIGAVMKRYTEKPEGISTASPGPMMTDRLVSYDKTMVLKTKPLAAFGTMDGMNPVDNVGDEPNAYKYQYSKSYVAHVKNLSYHDRDKKGYRIPP
jgi:hypothetical protein